MYTLSKNFVSDLAILFCKPIRRRPPNSGHQHIAVKVFRDYFACQNQRLISIEHHRVEVAVMRYQRRRFHSIADQRENDSLRRTNQPHRFPVHGASRCARATAPMKSCRASVAVRDFRAMLASSSHLYWLRPVVSTMVSFLARPLLPSALSRPPCRLWSCCGRNRTLLELQAPLDP